MSADNTILVVRTRKGNSYEYRVRHLQNAEMLDWDEKTKDYTKDSDGWLYENDDVRIVNARWMMENAEIFTDKDAAMERAFDLEEKIGYVEYGVCYQEIDREF